MEVVCWSHCGGEKEDEAEADDGGCALESLRLAEGTLGEMGGCELEPEMGRHKDDEIEI